MMRGGGGGAKGREEKRELEAVVEQGERREEWGHGRNEACDSRKGEGKGGK